VTIAARASRLSVHLYEDAGFVRITRGLLPVDDCYACADVLTELK
jgi:hypothetical protein